MMRLSTFPPLTSSSGVRRCLERIRSGRNHNNNLENVNQFKFTPKIEDIGKWRPSWRSFDYQELAAATDGFSPGDVLCKNIAMNFCVVDILLALCSPKYNDQLIIQLSKVYCREI